LAITISLKTIGFYPSLNLRSTFAHPSLNLRSSFAHPSLIVCWEELTSSFFLHLKRE